MKKSQTWMAAGVVAATSIATLSGVGAQAEDVRQLEAQRAVLVQSATVLAEPAGSASWLRSAWNSFTNVTKAVSPVRLGFAAVNAANVARRKDEQALVREPAVDDAWVRAV